MFEKRKKATGHFNIRVTPAEWDAILEVEKTLQCGHADLLRWLIRLAGRHDLDVRAALRRSADRTREHLALGKDDEINLTRRKDGS